MTYRKTKFAALFVFLLCTLLSTAAQTEDGAPKAVEVKVATIKSMDLYRSVFYGSRLRPRDRYIQRAPISGTLETIQVSPGEGVREGQVIGTVRRDLSGRNYKSVEIIAGQRGTVAEFDIQRGDPVQENQELIVILDTSALRAHLWVSDKDIPEIRIGDTAVVFEKGVETGHTGKIIAVPPEPDYDSGLFKVEVQFEPPAGLFVGKFIRIELRKDPYSGFAVSSEHIERKYGKDHLFIVTDGVVELREVQTGAHYDQLVSIESGVKAGEHYVISAGRRISDGTTVKIAGTPGSEGGE